MALLRVLHAQDLPDPGKLAKRIEELAASGGTVFAEQASVSAAAPVSRTETQWPALVDQVERSGQLRVAQVMRDWVRVIAIQPGELTCAIAPGYPGDPGPELRDALLRATGERWQVTFAEGEAQPTLRELAEASKAAEREAMMRHPLVETAFAAFPRAELIEDEAEVRDVAQAGRKWSRRP
jgi:DNA polymerase-3 subunit gamma/tau